MINIAFSGGRTSAMMTYFLTRELNSDDYLIIFTNTGKEKEQTLEFVQECADRWDLSVTWLEYCPVNKYKIVNFKTASRKGEPFSQLIEKRSYLPNVIARFCTQELKIRPVRDYLKDLGFDTWTTALGIRYDERKRALKILNPTKSQRWDNWLPLYERRKTISHVDEFWQLQPFKLNLKPHEGNCDLCFLKGIKKRIRILQEDPSIADWWISEELKVGGTFRKEYSVAQLLKKAELLKTQLSLFENMPDTSISCFCGD